MKESEIPYFDLYTKDHSGIAFEHWADSRSVALHRHSYYEVFLIERGSCLHVYQGQETLLIPGDAVLIPPHSAHGFTLSGVSSMFICQFLPDAIDKAVEGLIQNENGVRSVETSRIGEGIFWEHLLAEREDLYGVTVPEENEYAVNSSKQGVLHLNPDELSVVQGLFARAIHLNDAGDDLFMLSKRVSAEMLLLDMCAASRRQQQIYQIHSAEGQLVLADALRYLEEHLDEPMEFDELAQQAGFSPNHFRKLFREATGLSPVKYLNRLRITRACAYMQQDHLTAREAAERVGFIDMNYFSRTFKQVMGCSPSKL